MASAKTFLFVFAVIFAVYQVNSLNLIIGNPAGSTLRYRTNATRAAIVGQQVWQDVYYNAVNANLTYITAIENGVTQNATATLIAGGLNQRNATVRLISALSRGYSYTVEFWGR